MAEGIKLGGAFFETTIQSKIAEGLARDEAAAKAGSKRIADAIDQQMARASASTIRLAEANRKSTEGFKLSGAEVLKGAAGLAGFTSVASLAEKAITGVTESTKASAEATFAMSKIYGSGAAEMTAWSKALGDGINKSTTEVQQAAISVGSLSKTYGLSVEQQKVLVRQAADLATVHGKSLPDATARLQAAVRGEAEAAEALGLALNETRVATSQLGADGMKLWGVLTENEKAQLRLLEATKQLGEQQDAAQDKAQGATAAFDKLSKVGDELGAGIGTRLMPAVAAVAGVLAQMGDAALGALTILDDLASFDPGKILSVLDEVQKKGGNIFGAGASRQQVAREAQAAAAEVTKAREKAAADQKANADRADIVERGRQRSMLEAARKDADERVDIERKRIDAQREIEDKAFEQQRIQLEVRRETELKDVESRRDAAIQGLEEEKQAVKDSFDERIREAERARDAELKLAEQRHDDTVRQIEAEASAYKKASDALLIQIEKQRDTAIQAAEDRHDAAIAGIERETDAFKAARLEENLLLKDSRELEDRARADQRRREDQEAEQSQQAERGRLEQRAQDAEREHAATLKRLEDERDEALAAIDDQIQALRDAAEQEKRARDDAHKAALSNLDDETERVKSDLADRLKGLELEADGDRARHDAAVRMLDDETAGVKGRQAEALKGLDAESDGLKGKHQQILRDLEDEQDAARAASASVLRGIEDETDAARRAHDDALRGIDERARAEDGRHREALRQIDAEERARLGAVDAELAALDSADRQAQQAAKDRQLRDRVAAAETGVQRALNTGNKSVIDEARRALAEAQQAILDEQTDRERDAARSQLEAKKSAIQQEVAERRAAEDETARLNKERLDSEKRDAADALALALDGLKKRKQAEQDELATALAGLAQRRETEQGLYETGAAAIEQRREQVRSAAEAELASIASRKEAAGELLQQELADIAKRKDAYQTATAADLDAIQKRRAAEQAAYEAANLQAGDALEARLRELQQRKDATKDEGDRAIEKARERGQVEKEQHREALDRIKARFDDAKVKRDETRLAEDRDRTDFRADEDRALADSRLAQDNALKARKEAAQSTLSDEKRALDEFYNNPSTGVIAAHKQATADAAEQFKLRKEAADVKLAEERDSIRAHYDGPGGVIEILKKGSQDAEREYSRRLAATRAAYDAEIEQVKSVYTNTARTGLIDRLQDQHEKTKEELGKEVKLWETWREDTIKEIDKVKKAMEDAAKARAQVPGGVGPALPPEAPGGGPRGAALINAIEGLGASIGGAEFGRAAAAIAASETGGGVNLSEIGGTGAKGPLQFDPGGELQNYARSLGLSVQAAGDYAIQNPLHAAEWALKGYLGAALRAGLQQGLTGAALAVYGSKYGQRPRAGLEVKAGEWYDRLYADGGIFRYPTFTFTPKTGERGMIGETGRPERLLGVADTAAFEAMRSVRSPEASRGMVMPAPIALPAAMTAAAGAAGAAALAAAGGGVAGPIERQPMSISIGGVKLADLVVRGRQIAINTGRWGEDRSTKGRAKTGGASW